MLISSEMKKIIPENNRRGEEGRSTVIISASVDPEVKEEALVKAKKRGFSKSLSAYMQYLIVKDNPDLLETIKRDRYSDLTPIQRKAVNLAAGDSRKERGARTVKHGHEHNGKAVKHL
jgi:hypothetical protein